MANFIGKIGEQIFNFNFWREYERPIRKSMKKVDKYMDEAIGSLRKLWLSVLIRTLRMKRKFS